MGQVWLFMGHPGPTPPPPHPPNSPKCAFFHIGAHIWKTGDFFPLLWICLLCDEVLLPWKFWFTWFDVRAPAPPKYDFFFFFFFFFFIFWVLNLNLFYQMASSVDMYIDMGERIVGKQDRLSLIIEDPPQGPPNSPKYTLFFTFWPINEKLVFKLFPLVVHMSSLWWGLHSLTFWCPWYP